MKKTCSQTDRLHTVSDAPSGRTRVTRGWFGLFGISFGEKILNLQSVLEGPGAEAFLLANPFETTKNNQRHLNLQMPEDKLPDLSFFGGLARTRFHRMSNPFKFKFSFRGSVYAEDTYADADDTEGTPNRPASLRKETDASRHAWQMILGSQFRDSEWMS